MKPFIPERLPLADFQISAGNFRLLLEASRMFGEYRGKMAKLQNPQVLMEAITANEATLSSRIEGTQTELEETLGNISKKKSDDTPPQTEEEILTYLRQQDRAEVINYQRTLEQVIQSLETTDKAITLSLIRGAHASLLDSVRGKDKNPGKIRDTQNFIGAEGKGIEDATYIPPDPLLVNDLMDNWVDYVSSDADDIFVRLAILHAQFELIHPFEDGNGRLGRMLIPLILYSEEELNASLFYMSEYLEKFRDRYYQCLSDISTKGDWQQWINFFVTGIKVQAQRYCVQIDEILNLYEEYKIEIAEATHSQHAGIVNDFIFQHPIFTVSDLFEELDTERPTAHNIVKKLEMHELIEVKEHGGGSRPTVYRFKKYLDIVQSDWQPDI